MIKHTPGPWRTREIPDDDEVEAIDNGGCYVLRAKAFGCNQEEIQANAKLIAAAPELLEACKLLVELYDSDEIGGYVGEEARAAIAKAEGTA